MSLILLSKVLTGNDLKGRFTVPLMWLDENWPEIGDNCKRQLKVVHQVTTDVERCYEFVLSTRDGRYKKPVFECTGWLQFVKGRYKKPVFECTGWQQFVKDNDLHVDDVVYLGNEEGQNHYTIMVERKYV